MSAFVFNFSQSASDNDNNDLAEESNIDSPPLSVESNNKLPFREILVEENNVKNIDELISEHKVFSYGSSELKYVSPDYAIQFLYQRDENINLENIILAEQLHSDLIDGKYEGGFKIWECTNDLASYIDKNESIDFEKSTVLDLGCGTGVLGIAALKAGAVVHFQDYNEEVIIGATISNVILNTPVDERNDINNKCRFFAGDWSYLEHEMDKNPETFQYDYILTSETIYNPNSYPILYKIIKNRLKKTGYALIAAKSHYFGVGGSIRQFEDYIISHGFMKCEICQKSDQGLSREIMKVYFEN